MASPEQRLSKFVATLDFDDLPETVVETISRAFLDTVGVTLAGSVEGAGRQAFETADIDPADADTATLLGIEGPGTPESIALRVGTASHALDYDDLSWAMDGHPSVTLVPPLLALADEVGASGPELIAAYAAGFEIECAIAGPISPEHYEAGWHATSTFGTFGAAAAAAHLFNLDAEETERTLNVVASMPSGTKQNFGSMTKPLHAGLCSRSGVTAARLIRDGFTAGSAAISGQQGFWDLYSPKERDAFSIGDSLALVEEGIHVKAYPCCYFTHTSITATQALLDGAINPDIIERVEVRAAGGAGDALTHPNPKTGLEAKFSMEHAVAIAIVRDHIGLSAFEAESIDDPAVEQFRDRVNFAVNEDLPYDSHETRVRIVTDHGAEERRQVNPPGTHDNPLTDAELQNKFEECANRALPAGEVDRLVDVLLSFPTLSNAAAALVGHR